MKRKLRIIPLGGLGEIGLNSMIVQYGRDAVLVDCGIMFADDHLPGIDLVVPDFSYVAGGEVDLRAVLLTHAHEDHIGALPFLLRALRVPVHGSRFTLELVKEKLREHGLLARAQLKPAKPGSRMEVGPFRVEWIQMNHSIADALAVAIDTPEGKVVHTGDFRIDETPVDGRKTDLARFAELGKEGVLLLLSDSTNVEVPGSSRSEASVYEGLAEIARGAPGWVVVAFFSSHVPRMMQLVRLARETGRKVHLTGRSMVQNAGVARALGYIDVPDDLLVDLEDVAKIPRRKLMILSTGTQGEPRSALARMALDQHKELKLREGDRVILSSRFIPGNERAIYSIMNHLYRRGAEVFTILGRDVHVSGHACRGDLEAVLRAARPRYFIPVHGEYRQLIKHVELARETGVAQSRTLLMEDGDVAEFHKGEGRIAGRIKLSRSIVDGREIADIASEVLRDRRHLAETGIVVVVVIVDSHSGEVVRGPELFAKGLVGEELLEGAREVVADTVGDFHPEARTDDLALQEEIRLAVRRFFKTEIDRKPVVIPIVMEV